MNTSANDVNLVLIAGNSARAMLLRDTMSRCGIEGVIRRIGPGSPAVDCARQTGPYREKPLPDLFFLDFTDPDEESIAVLRAIALGEHRTSVPVVLMTSDYSQDLLDNGDLAGDKAVMFSPTSLPSFFRKMKSDKRPSFLKALRTLYQYGPILVRPPESQMQTAAA